MNFYKQSLILTTESLMGEQNILPKESYLDNSLILSKMKIFYKIKKSQKFINFNTSNYLNRIGKKKEKYILLFLEILYILNFKKKFSQRNMNRILVNYFSLVSISIRDRNNRLVIPESIIEDDNYISTLALCNLYSLSQFYENETKK